jgi:hypothetical protein
VSTSEYLWLVFTWLPTAFFIDIIIFAVALRIGYIRSRRRRA